MSRGTVPVRITYAACASNGKRGWFAQVWVNGLPKAHSFQRDVLTREDAEHEAHEWAKAHAAKYRGDWVVTVERVDGTRRWAEDAAP